MMTRLIVGSLLWLSPLPAATPAPAPAKPAAPAAKAPKPVLAPDPTAREPELSIPAGVQVTVIDFDAKTGTFLLSMNHATAVGPNYATPDNLHKALGMPGTLRDFENQRPQMIGSIYTLKRPCPLVGETEMSQREKKSALGSARVLKHR